MIDRIALSTYASYVQAMEGLAQRSVHDLMHLFKGGQGRSVWVDERLCKIAFVLHLVTPAYSELSMTVASP